MGLKLKGREVLVLGRRGSGKSLLLTYMATKTKRPVYSNFKIKLDNYRELTISDIYRLPSKCEIYFDEAYVVADSRESFSELNKKLSHHLFQLRKADRNVWVVAQKFSSIDVRLREDWDILVKCSRLEDPKESYDKWHFLYQFLIKKPNFSLENPEALLEKEMVIPYSYAKENLFHLFDTNEIVSDTNEAWIEYELLKRDREAFVKRAIEISKEVERIVEKPTWSAVKYALFKLEYVLGWTEPVYLELNNKIGGV